ncbi:hypothetical protein [Hymenobacter sp. AT01-02]|uniref:hypothetical protein n=1 Tax=Hymenobacter sp. AT01-02 TaxID=1571877 RepID=UPI000ADFEA0C|nr:hypothetical protein [Hymenobacter sp. AT01-02]
MLPRSLSRLPLLVLLALLCACSKSGSDAGQDLTARKLTRTRTWYFSLLMP